jgi:WD40 repeat protein
VATGAGDGLIRLWSVADGTCVAGFGEHAHAVWGLDFHAREPWLASASMDTTVKVWDTQTQRCRSTLRGHTQAVNAVVFQPQASALLASGGADRAVLLWDARMGQAAGPLLQGHASPVNALAFSPDGTRLVSGDMAGGVALWDMRTLSLLQATELEGTPAINSLAIGDDTLAVGAADSSIRLLTLPRFSVAAEVQEGWGVFCAPF